MQIFLRWWWGGICMLLLEALWLGSGLGSSALAFYLPKIFTVTEVETTWLRLLYSYLAMLNILRKHVLCPQHSLLEDRKQTTVYASNYSCFIWSSTKNSTFYLFLFKNPHLSCHREQTVLQKSSNKTVI